MTASVFERNLISLERRYPQLAQVIHPYAVRMDRVQCNPNACRELVNTLFRQALKQVILVGIGDGETLRLIHREVAPINLVIVEPEVRRFAAALQNVDLTRELDDPHVFWIVGDLRGRLENGLRYVKTALAAHGFQTVAEPTSYPPQSPQVASIAAEIHQIVGDESIHLRSRLARGMLVQTNLIRNFPYLMTSGVADQVRGRFREQPAVIIAAGPSLDKNVEQLERAGCSMLLIAVDTALRTLQRHGIEPHVVVSSDPTPLNEKHFDGITLSESTWLVYAPDCYFAIPERYAHLPRRICLYDNSSRLGYWLKDLGGVEELIERPMNVSEAAIRLALRLGCNPIIFTGLDLALAPDRETTHAAAAAHSHTIVKRTPNELYLKTREGQEQVLSLVQVEGWEGQPLSTYPSFQLYLAELERLMAETKVRWIDATEGGARKRGCVARPLSQVVTEGEAHRLEPSPSDVSWPDLRSRLPASMKENCLADLERIEKMEIDLRTAAEENASLSEQEHVWQEFLKDGMVRTWLDHAVFSYQLYEPVERLAEPQRGEALRRYAREAADRLHLMLPLLRDAFDRL